jgi:hypothetical protein
MISYLHPEILKLTKQRQNKRTIIELGAREEMRQLLLAEHYSNANVHTF